MKKALKRASIALLLLGILSSCGGGGVADTTLPEATDEPSITEITTEAETTEAPKETEDVMIDSISVLNTAHGEGSHNGKTATSSLEFDFRTGKIFKSTELIGDSSYYPRLKKLADGSYILFFQNGRWGPDIYYKTSTDLAEWSKPVPLFSSYKSQWGDTRAFATADAAVLDNGDILVVCCYRSLENYTKNPERNGLMMKRSTDNGKTWSDEEIIYVGTTWEPCVLQHSSGEVQVYLTHTAPYIALYGYNNTIRSSGSAILRSKDGGKTFTPKVTAAPFEADRVMQCYVGDLNGIKIFNDQMPVAIELADGTIAVACETQTIDKKFGISLGWSYDNFAVPLKIDEVGPKDRETRFITGVAPYLAVFESGETLLSYTRGTIFRIRMGNEKAKGFDKEILPMEGKATSLWGALEITDSHKVTFVTDYQPTPSDNNTYSLLTMGSCYLNHDLTAKRMTPTLDGNGEDWKDNRDALFLGSVSQAQCSFRFACDDENVYILCQRLDEYINKGEDEEVLYLSCGDGKFYKLTVGCEGIEQFMVNEGGQYSRKDADGIKCAVALNGKVGKKGGADNGYSAEIAVPRSMIGFDGTLRFGALLKNKDKDGSFENDGFASVDLEKVDTWFEINFD